MQESAFKIYNASAGSGKTFTLVKEYLKIVLSSGHPTGFKQILAITFTNKAVNEMKQRILKSLFLFATTHPESNEDSLFLSLCESLAFSPQKLQQQSKTALRYILHNYAFFDVATIDKFTHRLIRTFSRDLQLPHQFEVVLDQKELMQEVVARLLSRAGSDAELTKTLIAFSLEKIEADKSWDISFDLNEIGQYMFDENHLEPLGKLGSKSHQDFRNLKSMLREKARASESSMKERAEEALALIKTNGLETQDFKAGYFPKFLLQVVNNPGNLSFDAAWKVNFGQEPLYSQKLAQERKEILDTLLPRFAELFIEIRRQFFLGAYFNNAYRNLVPLSILNALKSELDLMKAERELLPISTFNQLIADEIKDQPAPYIYERLGEKYRHYFIDEFQDTSELQWNNLVPLISNALEGQDESGRRGSLFLVGDAKQAIYRWRGGKAEQFLNLLNLTDTVFTIGPEIKSLPRNYRSHEEIITFNNEFFRTTSPVLSKPYYQHLFNADEGQRSNELKDGQVVLEFIDKADAEEDTAYNSRIAAYINTVLAQGYAYRDICILTRKIKQGVQVAEYLMEIGIPVISSETLLLNTSPEVRFCIALLQFAVKPEELQARYDILEYLNLESTKAPWGLVQDLKEFQVYLTSHYEVDWDLFREMHAFDALEYAIQCFDLNPDSNAYLSFLLDESLQAAQKEGTDTATFLSHWDRRKEKISIVAPEGINAINIMTIHKAKGLEFPIVIFPYANTPIYEEKNPKLWTQVPKETHCGFESLLLSKKKEMQHYPGDMAELFMEEQAKLELDAFNLLYVALTRSIAGLYIITEYTPRKENAEIRSYSDLFLQFLRTTGDWEDHKRTYPRGKLPKRSKQKEAIAKPVQEPISYGYSKKWELEHKLIPKRKIVWDPAQEKALAWGNLFHNLMAQVQTAEDITNALKTLATNPLIKDKELSILEEKASAVVNHASLKSFFDPELIVRNESEIITENGLILRPDRIVFKGNEATILDYKTGNPSEQDKRQLNSYGEALQAMGYQVNQKVLVYTSEEIAPIFIP